MKREIKFRGKCVPDSKYAGEWVTGGYVPLSEDITPNNEGLIMRFIGGDGTITYHVDPDTVGQFTGLYDKNGVEIYEGDVVKHPYIDPIFGDLVEAKDGEGVTSQVVFHDGSFVIKYDIDRFIYLDEFTRRNCVEVIGNIHDNKEKV